MTNKPKFIITAAILIIILLSGITFGTRIIFIKKIVPPKDSGGVFITGISGGQRAGLIKEIDNVSKQFSYIEKGDALLKKNQVDEAINAYETALSLAKSSGAKGEAHICLANSYEKKKDYENALKKMIIVKDKFVNDWAKEPVVERAKYLECALRGEYDLAVEHAQKALEADAKLPNTPKGGSPDYIERLNDLKAAKDYILSLKKK